jgi:protein SCO1/2
VKFLSHTIDPAHDTVAVLREYADKLGIQSKKWHLVTGDENQLYGLARNSYLVTASKAMAQPGGILHSGAFILVDKQGRVRNVYDGTTAEEVDKLMKDMESLLSK